MSKKKKKNKAAKTVQKHINQNQGKPEKSSKPVHDNDPASDTPVKTSVDNKAAAVTKSADPSSPKSKAVSHHDEEHHVLKPAVSYAYILILFVLLIVVFVLKLMDDQKIKDITGQNEQLKAAILTASDNIAQLSAENTEQKKQLEALSLALNARTEMAETQKKEEAESSVPELYPVKGDAIVVSAPENVTTENPEDENLLRFNMYEGSYAIATGNGIIEIVSDGGDGLINIVIDHGNGYKSSHIGEGIALKEAGDEIKRGDAVMIFTGDGMDFTYSLSLDGKTVDPVSVMSIDG